MKAIKLLSFALIFASLFVLTSCMDNSIETDESPAPNGQIYLYGEAHGVEKILAKELELWGAYYHNEGMRHLFVEFPYYSAEFLNIWMKSDNDDILNALYADLEGTQAHVTAVMDFYKQIKAEYPETVFHGTDVGHQYSTTGERYLSYLKENGMENSSEYTTALEAIAQGKRFYESSEDEDDFIYREDKMVENFIREFDKLNGESVMGIYGAIHTPLDGKVLVNSDHPCMANQLKAHYGEIVHSEDISWLALDNKR